MKKTNKILGTMLMIGIGLVLSLFMIAREGRIMELKSENSELREEVNKMGRKFTLLNIEALLSYAKDQGWECGEPIDDSDYVSISDILYEAGKHKLMIECLDPETKDICSVTAELGTIIDKGRCAQRVESVQD